MRDAEAVRALVSVHDVMPETLERVQRILDLCAAINPVPLTLLVVPGLGWDCSGSSACAPGKTGGIGSPAMAGSIGWRASAGSPTGCTVS